MSKKENTPASAATLTGAADGTDRADRIPVMHCNTDREKPQAIFDLLPQGEGNAVRSKQLAALMGVRTVRELQTLIAAEREEGKLILSTCRNGGGYYRPSPGAAGHAEISAYCHTLRARALNTLRALKAAKMALGALDGQLDFDDLGVL